MDGVEVVQDLERAFDIHVSNDEATRTLTVGDFYDLLLAKIPANEADRKCASAMAFYRLRCALNELGYGSKLTPESDLSFLHQGRVRPQLARLEKVSGLNLPKAVQTGWGRLTAFAAFTAVWTTAVSVYPSFLTVVLGGFAGIGGAILVLKYIDPGKMPHDCRTLADLTQKAAILSYGRLVKMGARHSEEDIWKALLEVLSVWALPKAEITRDTFFLKSQLKNAAA